MARLSGALVLVVPLVALLVADLPAQGVTSAAIYGVVTGADSSVISDAIVTATNTANGERWQTVSRARGRYSFESLAIGGPYLVEARAIGFIPATATGITLSLGERHRVDLALTPTVAQLPELTVTAVPDPQLNASRTGPAQTFTGAMANSLPLGRDFSQLVLLSPQAALSRNFGVSIAGQPDRLNGFQVDRASNADLGGIHGVSGFGTPGATSGVRTLSLEAIQEMQILSAPFDVRYGNFAGGLVNVVTRSGSNRWEGSLSGYFQNQTLTGKDSAGNRAEEFSTQELTVTLAGPIVRDRVAFFLNAGLQGYVGTRPPSIGTDTTGGADSVGIGIRRESALRFQDILTNTYHVDPGSIGSAPPRNPAGNLLAKITLWPGLNQRIELSHNYAQGTSQRGFEAVELSSHTLEEPSTFNDSRVTWTASGGPLANELTLARLESRERCLPAALFPEIGVVVGAEPDLPALSRWRDRPLPRPFRRPDDLGVNGQRHMVHGSASFDSRDSCGDDPSKRLPAGQDPGRTLELRQSRLAGSGAARRIRPRLRTAVPA